MKTMQFRSLLFAAITIFALTITHTVRAHGGEPRLEISADRFNPGAALEVRGVDFEYEEEITVALIGSQIEISLGTAIADAEGGFTQNIILPADLTEGVYALRATTYDHVIFSPAFTVWGTAVLAEGAQREEEEPLLAPMPGSEIVTPTQTTGESANAASKYPTSSLLPIFLFILLLGIVVFVLRMKRTAGIP